MHRGRTGALVAGAGLVLLGASGCGSQAVSSGSSLDTLGTRLAKDGRQAYLQVAGTAQPSASKVTAKADRDVTCPGGHRREFAATFTAARSIVGDGDLANSESLAAQAAFKPLGYTLSTDVSGTVPTTLRFANDPKSGDQRRTFTTTVRTSGDDFVWRLTGRTACVAD